MKEIIQAIEKLWFEQKEENQEVSYRFLDGYINNCLGVSHHKKVKILKLYILNQKNYEIIGYKYFTGTYKEILEQLQKLNIKELL